MLESKHQNLRSTFCVDIIKIHSSGLITASQELHETEASDVFI